MGPGRRRAVPHGDLRSGDDAGPGPAGERTGGLTTTANAGGSPGVVRRRWRRSCRCCICGGCRRADFRGALPVLLGKDAAGPESDEHLAADGGRGREVLGRSGSGTCRRAAASTGGWTGSIDGPYRPARGRVARTAAAGGVPRSRSARSAWGPGPPRGGAGWQVMECRRLYRWPLEMAAKCSKRGSPKRWKARAQNLRVVGPESVPWIASSSASHPMSAWV